MTIRKCARVCVPSLWLLLASVAPLAAQDGGSMRDVEICVIIDGELTSVDAQYDTETGDTLTWEGEPFSTVYADEGQYGFSHDWYADNEPIRLLDAKWDRYGLPRVLSPWDLALVGAVDGVNVYAIAGETDPDLVYVAIRSGCEFQPYTRSE